MILLNKNISWSNEDLSEFEKHIFIHLFIFLEVTLYLHNFHDYLSIGACAGQIHVAHSTLKGVWVTTPNTKPALLTAR